MTPRLVTLAFRTVCGLIAWIALCVAVYTISGDNNVGAAFVIGSGAVLAIAGAVAAYRHESALRKQANIKALGLDPQSPTITLWLATRAFRLGLPLNASAWDILAVDFGRVARFGFFVGAASLVIALANGADWSAYHTPLAQVTLSQLANALGKSILLILAVVVWLRWAFADGRKEYKAWALFGAFVVSLSAVVAAVVGLR